MLFGLNGRGAQGKALRFERDFRQPEVENLRLTSIGDEDICGLDVAMDDALRVCRVESVGDLNTQIKHRFDLQRLTSDSMPERLTLQQFHGDEGSPVGFVNLIDGADVGVVQRGRGLGLPLKTAEGLSVFGELVGKELQGDVAAELQVFRLVHNTHPAAAQLLYNAIVRDGLADHAEDAWFSGLFILKTRLPPVNPGLARACQTPNTCLVKDNRGGSEITPGLSTNRKLSRNGLGGDYSPQVG